MWWKKRGLEFNVLIYLKGLNTFLQTTFFSKARDAFRQSIHGVFTRVQLGVNGEKPVE